MVSYVWRICDNESKMASRVKNREVRENRLDWKAMPNSPLGFVKRRIHLNGDRIGNMAPGVGKKGGKESPGSSGWLKH